jgi:simple sugar transport system substrate-binding protein
VSVRDTTVRTTTEKEESDMESLVSWRRRGGFVLMLLGVLVALVAAGCGGDDSTSTSSAAAPAASDTAAAAPSSAAPTSAADTATTAADTTSTEAPSSSADTATATDATTGETTAAVENTKVKKIAIIAPEKGNDYGWNQQGVEGAKAVATAVGAEAIVQDGAGYEDVTPVLGQVAKDGANLIIAQASGYNTAAPQAAERYKVPVLTYDKPANKKEGLVADIETLAGQGAYLAGVLAAKASKTGTLGIVISADDTNWHKQEGGYVAGAKSVNPSVKFVQAQIGQAGYADAAGGKRVTDQVIAGGADVIFGMGDGSSFGMLQSVETAKPPAGADKVWFIDVIGDKTPVDKKGVLLSSVLWNFEPAFTQAVNDINTGTFGQQNYELNLANGGISLLQTKNIPADAWTAAETAKAGIIDGSIEVPLTATADDVKALING